MKCDSCSAARKGDRVAAGWKRHQDLIWCPDCWRRSYMLRAVTVPVAGPVGCEWSDLREIMKRCWADATALANWATSELYRHDVMRTPAMLKLGKYPERLYLYPDARKIVPDMDPQSVCSLLQAIEGKYRARRFKVIWERSESLPNFHYPVPYPVHNQSWSASIDEGGATLLSARFGGERRTMRLRGGAEFHRQLRAVKQLISGAAVAGELALYEVSVSANANRIGGESREPGGGKRESTRLMAKMVLWLPKAVGQRAKEGTLFLTTGQSTFWHYRVGEGQIRTLHADHLKRAETMRKGIGDHRNRLDKIGDDQKYNRRSSRRRRNWTNERREAWCRKQNNRLDTFIHQETIELAKIAERMKVASVVYDDSDQSYFDSFPWAAVREKLEYKLDERGIAFVHANAKAKAKKAAS